MAKDVEKKPKKEKKHFFKDFKAELKKVIWPTPKQVAKNTVAVITIVLITAVIVFALDLIFEALNTYGVNNLRKLVKDENAVTTENTATESTEETSEEGENPVEESAEGETSETDEPSAEENVVEAESSTEQE